MVAAAADGLADNFHFPFSTCHFLFAIGCERANL
jgi:hypothetical protein